MRIVVMFVGAFLAGIAGAAIDRVVEAQNLQVQETKPYEFAELPHGFIYKAVHEGCELYIVEANTDSTHMSYSIATGRGCK